MIELLLEAQNKIAILEEKVKVLEDKMRGYADDKPIRKYWEKYAPWLLREHPDLTANRISGIATPAGETKQKAEKQTASTASDPRTYGHIAYEAYRKKSNGKSLVSGDEIPEWVSLQDDVKRAWSTAGNAVVDAVKDEPRGIATTLVGA